MIRKVMFGLSLVALLGLAAAAPAHAQDAAANIAKAQRTLDEIDKVIDQASAHASKSGSGAVAAAPIRRANGTTARTGQNGNRGNGNANGTRRRRQNPPAGGNQANTNGKDTKKPAKKNP